MINSGVPWAGRIHSWEVGLYPVRRQLRWVTAEILPRPKKKGFWWTLLFRKLLRGGKAYQLGKKIKLKHG
jgi:hypothetical protein